MPYWFHLTGSQGKLGLGYSPNIQFDTPILSFLKQNRSLYPSFSLCLKSQGGKLGIGVDPKSIQSNITWTDIYQNTSNLGYGVVLSKLAVKGTQLQLGSQALNGIHNAALIDSASMFIALTSNAYHVFTYQIIAQCSNSVVIPGVCPEGEGESLFDGYCFPLTAHHISLLPSFGIAFAGSEDSYLTIDPTDYLVQQGNLRCLGIVDSGVVQETRLGQVFLRKFYTLFDLKEKRVGFSANASSNCSIY
eukprot:TRINITY_DN9266_c0_g2_i2.p1 TRINITY_DN9266_c0_g2~~TRINITY_DN9266_c0_g2_i2.p1  ORF type:complete len:247 (-),score=26.22 TRINITY_DN9266_c0_g2_i2:95-835(-)